MSLERSDLLKIAELLNVQDGEEDNINYDIKNNDNVRKNPYEPLASGENNRSCYPTSIEEVEDCFDHKSTPDYEITYKQAIGTEDVFLGIGNRTPSSLSCEDMIVKVALPEETFTSIDLKVNEQNIVIEGVKHYLDLSLPHSTDPDKSNAKWDKETEKLILNLRIVREFDNFHF